MENSISSKLNRGGDFFLPNTSSGTSNYGYLITFSLTAILATSLIALALWHGLNMIRKEVTDAIRNELKIKEDENQRLIQMIEQFAKMQATMPNKLSA